MKRVILSLVFLFCFHGGSRSNPVSENENISFYIYSYTGIVDTTTSACDESLARWTISGNLSLYFNTGYIVAKLDDVKTSLFNGNRSSLEQAQEKEIPKESEAVLQPFVIQKEEDKSFSILVNPNEPLWSVNMKKSIASFFNFDFEAFANKNLEPDEKVDRPYEEQTIYGNCKGTYSKERKEPGNDINITIYEKLMNGWTCTDTPLRIVANTLRAPVVDDLFDAFDFGESSIFLAMTDDNNETFWRGFSKTNMTYKVMRSSPYILNTVQKQIFELLGSKKVKNSVDISELTDKRSLIYEFGSEPTLGRHSYEQNQSELVKQYLDYYEQFHKNFLLAPEENYDIRKVDPVEKMFLTLMIMNNQGLKDLEQAIKETKKYDMANFHFNLLSYIGTNESIKYFSKFMQTVPNYGNSIPLLKAFATIPRHIRYPTNEILADMEPWLHLENMNDPHVRNAAVLSFASVIGHSCKKQMISEKNLEKYTEIFNNNFLEGKNYEERMTYLLGLINMAECLTSDFINGIATNTSESADLRVLALTGFKNQLLYESSNKIYETYWPIVQNKSEPFKVRVAALEVLLFVRLTAEEFYSIVEKYSQHFNDPEDTQLANYLITSLHSSQNINSYNNNMRGAKATEAVKNASIPPYPRDWATGYYRLSYTDNETNFGAYLDAHLITDPKTNMVNIVQLTFNNFAASFDFGTYSVYLNIDGWIDWLCIKDYIENLEASSVPELLNLLKENNFKLQGINKNIRFDLIVFVDRVAVYFNHMRNFDRDQLNRLGDELDDFVSTSQYVTYPVMEFVHIPSHLGTPILITNYLQDISTFSIGKKNNLDYRSSWTFQTWIEAYNPLADTNIASYKYYVDEKCVNIEFSGNITDKLSFQWKSERDSYIQFWDSMMGTAVEDEEVLKQYCQECNPFNELPTDNYVPDVNNLEPFGFEVIAEIMSYNENNDISTFKEIFYGKYHLANVDALPLTTPILYLAHAQARKLWLKSELSRGSYISHPTNAFDGTYKSQTTLSLDIQGKMNNRFVQESNFTITPELVTIDLKTKDVLNVANMSYHVHWFPSKDDEGNNNMALHQELKLRYKSVVSSRTFKVCANREVFFPGIRSDRLSLEPFETTKGKTVIAAAKNYDDDEDCDPKIEFIFTEVFSGSDKEKILEDENVLKDYEQCLIDSKDLKFTAPTAECKRASDKLTEYHNYKAYMTKVIHLEDRNTTETFDEPLFEISRAGKHKIKLAVVKRQLNIPNPKPEEPYYSTTIYYPKQFANPNWLAYNEHYFAGPKFARSTCSISPSRIQQFSGKYISNLKKEWLAFAECYNVSTRGLLGQTIGDKHVGFTFYSNEHVVTATVIEGKAEIKTNGTAENVKVEQLGENVFHIRDKQVDIYYNTEYISVKVPSVYDKLLCGICSEEN